MILKTCEERLRDNLPSEIVVKPRFVCYRLHRRGGGRYAKVPVDSLTGRAINHRDHRYHLHFEHALSILSGGQVSGLGYVLDDSEVLVDLDHCLAEGTPNPFSKALLDSARTYAEVSVSGTGIKMLLRGQKPGKTCRAPGIELYGPGFFAALTGERRSFFGVEARQKWLEHVYRALLLPSLPEGPGPTPPPLSLQVEETLNRARRARNGRKFSRLYDEGITDDYPSLSEAHFALVRLLRFWVGDRPEIIDQLFRHSRLLNSKWDRPLGDTLYGRRTIQRAMELGGPTYQPSQQLSHKKRDQ